MGVYFRSKGLLYPIQNDMMAIMSDNDHRWTCPSLVVTI